MSLFNRVTIASRVFCFAVILGLGLLSRDVEALLSLAIIALVATTAIYITLATPLATALVVTAEAAATGLIIALALPAGVVFLPYLVVLTLIAGIARGLIGVSAVVIAQFGAIAVITVAAPSGGSLVKVFELLSPWLITSIGVGLLGSWLAGTSKGLKLDGEDDASYESAHRLLTQLRTVARRLSSGLDPVNMASQILDVVAEQLGPGPSVVYVRTDGGVLSPLAYSGPEAQDHLPPHLAVSSECWAEMEPTFKQTQTPATGQIVSLPLRVGSRMIGVIMLWVPGFPSGLDLTAFMRELDGHSMRLDTALTFDEVRTIATVEERRRLAREIHDGIAQEVASLGYLVDDLVATAESDSQRESLATLREELTRVVSELRLSIFDLKSEVLPETGLGVALSEYVRQVGSRSNLTVHVTLDEAPTRLRAESETQLLRIAQEAITNARKHSGAENLWVNCRVIPPFAQLEIRDDGVGLSEGRHDSYGLRIMKERAERLDGRLEIRQACEQAERPGTVVKVTIGCEPVPVSRHRGGQK